MTCNLEAYKNKSIAELEYIIKDAGEAAKCMVGVNTQAELKYLDQMNDARTIINRKRGE